MAMKAVIYPQPPPARPDWTGTVLRGCHGRRSRVQHSNRRVHKRRTPSHHQQPVWRCYYWLSSLVARRSARRTAGLSLSPSGRPAVIRAGQWGQVFVMGRPRPVSSDRGNVGSWRLGRCSNAWKADLARPMFASIQTDDTARTLCRGAFRGHAKRESRGAVPAPR